MTDQTPMTTSDTGRAATGPLPLQIEPIVRAALLEDLGRAGDITTDAVVPPDIQAHGALVARRPGTIAGVEAAAMAFRLLDPDFRCIPAAVDGDTVGAGQTILTLQGRARTMLTGERVALNLISHLSGIATETARLVAETQGTRAVVTCTRKTTPGLRLLEKAAIRAGGGVNHRFGLDDAILIKDNHIALAGGVAVAIRRARAAAGHLVRIEVEVDTLDQLRAALPEGPDVVLLDNMDPAMLAEAVAIVDGRAVTEASGGITVQTIGAIARSGVDVISAGWLTHSAPALDIGLDILDGIAAGN